MVDWRGGESIAVTTTMRPGWLPPTASEWLVRRTNTTLALDELILPTEDGIEIATALRAAPPPHALDWTLSVPGGIHSPRRELDGSITFASASSARYRISAPIAVDNRGQRIPITGRLKGNTFEIEADWSSAEFPVLVDPSLERISWERVDSAPARTRQGYAAAQDAQGQVVLFGGHQAGQLSSETLVLQNGGGWLIATPSQRPSRRHGHAMAYHAITGETVLHGGFGELPNGSFGMLNDTWSWSGTDWTLVSTSGPTARFHHAMASVPGGDTMLFGGLDGSGQLMGDTWRWNGSNWQLAHSGGAGAPPKRQLTAMMSFTDINPGNPELGVILFGGAGSTGNLADTWVWTGTAWVSLAGGPPARSSHSMTFDINNGDGILLHGGRGNTGELNDTWAFQAGAWSRKTDLRGPLPTSGHALVELDAWGAMIIAEGDSSSDELQVWAYGINGAWFPFASGGTQPTPRAMHAAAAGDNGDTLIFGLS